ncbi:hypothetical protein ACIRSS_01270 [Amycolatopsis sp. NPDC101161]|uniref:hypothetical protein n=1 Tax=Amycolatopsis sp. NPDC101161 TaxID=3363940 RepID=UPI003827905B
MSTLDLVGRRLILVSGPGRDWPRTGDFDVHIEDWLRATGIADSGAVSEPLSGGRRGRKLNA